MPKKKTEIKVQIELTLKTLYNLSKELNGKEVAIAWRRGSKAENRGESKTSAIRSGIAVFGDQFTLHCTLFQDPSSLKYEGKKLELLVKQQGEGSSSSSKKSTSGGGKPLAKAVVDLTEFATSGIKENISFPLVMKGEHHKKKGSKIIGRGKSKSSASSSTPGKDKGKVPAIKADVKTVWTHYNKKKIATKAEADSLAASSSSSSSSDPTAATTITDASTLSSSTRKKDTVKIDGVEHDLITVDEGGASEEEQTTVAEFTEMEDDTESEFTESSEDDDDEDEDDGFKKKAVTKKRAEKSDEEDKSVETLSTLTTASLRNSSSIETTSSGGKTLSPSRSFENVAVAEKVTKGKEKKEDGAKEDGHARNLMIASTAVPKDLLLHVAEDEEKNATIKKLQAELKKTQEELQQMEKEREKDAQLNDVSSKQEVKQLKKEVLELKKIQKEAQKSQEELKRLEAELKEERRKVEVEKREKRDMERDMKNMESKLRTAEKKVDGFESKKKKQEESNNTNKKLTKKELMATAAAANETIAAMKEEKERKEKELEQANKEKIKLSKEAELLRQQTEEQSAELERKAMLFTALRAEFEKLKEATTMSSASAAAASESSASAASLLEKRNAELEIEIARVSAELEQTNFIVAEKDKELLRWKDKVKALELEAKRVEEKCNARVMAAEAKAKSATLKKDATKIEEEKEREEEIARLKEELDDRKTKIEEQKKRIERLEEQLEELQEQQHQHDGGDQTMSKQANEEEEEEKERLKEMKKKAEKAVKRLEEENREKQLTVERLQKQLKKLEEERKKEKKEKKEANHKDEREDDDEETKVIQQLTTQHIYCMKNAFSKEGTHISAAQLCKELVEMRALEDDPPHETLLAAIITSLKNVSTAAREDNVMLVRWLSFVCHFHEQLENEVGTSEDENSGDIPRNGIWIPPSRRVTALVPTSENGDTSHQYDDEDDQDEEDDDAVAQFFKRLERLIFEIYSNFVSNCLKSINTVVVGGILQQELSIFATDGTSIAGHESSNKEFTSVLTKALKLLRQQHLFDSVIQQFFCQLFYNTNARIVNTLVDRKELCTCGNGFQIKLGLSQLEEWVSKQGRKLFGVARQYLSHATEAANVLVVDKEMFGDEVMIASIFPTLSVFQIYHLLDTFQPDQFSPEGVSSSVLRHLEGLCSKAKQHQSTSLKLNETALLTLPTNKR
ncbi:Chromatin assembly factor 1 subunit A [Balamuthia mandrillaris]